MVVFSCASLVAYSQSVSSLQVSSFLCCAVMGAGGCSSLFVVSSSSIIVVGRSDAEVLVSTVAWKVHYVEHSDLLWKTHWHVASRKAVYVGTHPQIWRASPKTK
jgi:hypothetical protein